MPDDEIGKIQPTDLSEDDQKFLQSDEQKAVAEPENSPEEIAMEKFKTLLDSGEITMQDLQEKLIDKDMSPETFLEFIKAERENTALLYLLSIPGTCSHIVLNNENDRPDPASFKKLVDTLRSEDKLSFRSKKDSREPFLSLHVALANGITTMGDSHWNWALAAEVPRVPKEEGKNDFLYEYEVDGKDLEEYRNRTRIGVSGYILKPEFLTKIGPVGEMTYRDAVQAVETFGGPISQNGRGLINTYIAKENVLHGRRAEMKGSSKAPYEEDSAPEYRINPNYGIRAVAIKENGVEAVPVTNEDIAYFFTVEPVPINMEKQKVKTKSRFLERIKLFRLDGTELSQEEIQELANKGQEEKIWEKYHNYFDNVRNGEKLPRLLRDRGDMS